MPRGRVKRRIPLDLVDSVTVSKVSNEFIIHVPTEYDQRYRVETQYKFMNILKDAKQYL